MTNANPSRPRLTVCIPSSRFAAGIADTLNSVKMQTFEDFQVVVGVEPMTAADREAGDPKALDARFAFTRNAEILGWAKNIDHLISSVATELFTILPDDDVWEPHYLRTLVDAIDENPHASVTYCDVARFGAAGGTKRLVLDNTDLGTRLFSFYLGNAAGIPWRGVTRASVLKSGGRNFPENPQSSYGAEVEWAQHLLCCGSAIRISQSLFRKRTYSPDGSSLSRQWIHRWPPERREAAIEEHRSRMLAGIPNAVEGGIERVAIELACEIAMLKRGWGFAGLAISGVRKERAAMVRSRLTALQPSAREPLLAYLDRVVAGIDRSEGQRH